MFSNFLSNKESEYPTELLKEFTCHVRFFLFTCVYLCFFCDAFFLQAHMYAHKCTHHSEPVATPPTQALYLHTNHFLDRSLSAVELFPQCNTAERYASLRASLLGPAVTQAAAVRAFSLPPVMSPARPRQQRTPNSTEVGVGGGGGLDPFVALPLTLPQPEFDLRGVMALGEGCPPP